MNNNLNNNLENENEKNEKKTVQIEKKSAWPILSVGITWLIFAFIFSIDNPTKIFCAAVLSFIVYQIVKSKCPPKKVQIPLEDEKPQKPQKAEVKETAKKEKEKAVNLTPEEKALKDLNERMDLYAIEIGLLKDYINDEFITNELNEIDKSLKKIHVQLNDEAKVNERPRRIEQLTDFFDYYMPTTTKILNSYNRIKKQDLTGENATETKKRVEESLPFIRKAFEKELDNLFSAEMLDITTDIDVLEALLSKDGLMEKNSINDYKDIKNDMKNDFFD
jgi:hypothetical protein